MTAKGLKFNRSRSYLSSIFPFIKMNLNINILVYYNVYFKVNYEIDLILFIAVPTLSSLKMLKIEKKTKYNLNKLASFIV